MQEAAKIARANGTKVATFAHSDPEALERTLATLRPYRSALVCIDGVYSMSGRIPPMAELDAVARAHDAVLYIDDAHGTGVLGEQGRGTVLEALGSYENAFVVGSLSKAFSCAGGFIGCPESFHRLLKIRCSPYVFGGPVVPSYLEAIGTVVDILRSDEYPALRAQLDGAIRRLTRGLAELGLTVMGGATPIVSILIGDEGDTLNAGKFLFDRGYLRAVGPVPGRPLPRGGAADPVQRQPRDRVDRGIDRGLRGADANDEPLGSNPALRADGREASPVRERGGPGNARLTRDARRPGPNPPDHARGRAGPDPGRDRAGQGREAGRRGTKGVPPPRSSRSCSTVGCWRVRPCSSSTWDSTCWRSGVPT